MSAEQLTEIASAEYSDLLNESKSYIKKLLLVRRETEEKLIAAKNTIGEFIQQSITSDSAYKTKYKDLENYKHNLDGMLANITEKIALYTVEYEDLKAKEVALNQATVEFDDKLSKTKDYYLKLTADYNDGLLKYQNLQRENSSLEKDLQLLRDEHSKLQLESKRAVGSSKKRRSLQSEPETIKMSNTDLAKLKEGMGELRSLFAEIDSGEENSKRIYAEIDQQISEGKEYLISRKN